MQKSNIDDIVTEVSDILLTSAKSTFVLKISETVQINLLNNGIMLIVKRLNIISEKQKATL